MTDIQVKKDLIVLVADKNMEFAVKGLLARPHALRIRPIEEKLYQHPWRDAGCRSNGVNFLRPFINQFHHALLMFDKEGCGQETRSCVDLESSLEADLASSGWDNRASAIVINPELENWVWSDSPHVDNVLGWQGKQPNLRNWLLNAAFLIAGQQKPDRPKEAMEAALRVSKKARSSSLFLQLAQNVSFERCDDPAFLKFKTTMSSWFPV